MASVGSPFVSVQTLLSSQPGYVKLVYFDASAIVKLLIKDGSIKSVADAKDLFHGSGVVVRTTAICFAETLQVLKRKRFFPSKSDVPLTELEYINAVAELYGMMDNTGLMGIDPIQLELDLFNQAEVFVKNHKIDHSDALQIATLRKCPVDAYLCTSDNGLATAASVEKLKVAFLN